MDLHGKYRMGPRLGGGGMADVYRADVAGAEGFLRPVAIKRLHAALSADETFCAMFVREARLLSQLHHANIVSVLDFEWDERGQLFLVMELVDGVDLSQLMEAGDVPVTVAVYVIAAVLRALAYAHERQIIHRDITPHNVLISWLGEVKLSDFGLAKAAVSSHVSPVGTLKGKVKYLSPDQIQGLKLDGRTDLFSVGVMLYELVTGRTPFAGARQAPHTMAESIARMLTGTIVPPRDLRPEVPAAVDAVIMRLLERERNRRFTSAQEVLAALPCPPGGAEELAALLVERFPDMKAGSDEPPSSDVASEIASGPQIRGRAIRGRTRASRRARVRWLRNIVLLAMLLAVATISTERWRGQDGAGAARALGEPTADAGIDVDAVAMLSGEVSIDVTDVRGVEDVADAGVRDAGVSRVRQRAPAKRPMPDRMPDRMPGRGRKPPLGRDAESSPASVSAGLDAGDGPVDAAPAPVRGVPDAAPAIDKSSPSYAPYTRSEPWLKIEGNPQRIRE